MAYKGKVIDNPFSGEVLRFIETAADTNGEYLRIKWKLPAKKAKSGSHKHANIDEWYEVVQGTLSYSINGIKGVARPGDKVFFPKGITHQHNNMFAEDLVFIYTCSPALDMEQLIESATYLSITGKAKNGNPSLLQTLYWTGNTKAKVYDSGLPVFIQDFLACILSPIGKIFGYRRLSG